MVSELRIGIIGLGVGAKYARAASEMGAEVALCDVDTALLKRVASEIPGATTFEDWRALVTEDQIQAIVVATPDALHRAMVLEALRHGKHVLCETPLDVKRAGAELILDAVEEVGVHFLVAHRYRFHPLVRRLCQELAQVGDPGLVEVRWLRPGDEVPGGWRLDPEWRRNLATGEGVDVIDLLRLIGGEIFEVTGFATRRFQPEWPFADTLTVSGRFVSGAALHAVLSVTTASPPVTQIHVHGRDGVLRLDLEDGELILFRGEDVVLIEALDPDAAELDLEETILRTFVELLRNGEENPCSALDAAGTVAAAIAVADATAVNLPSRIRPVRIE